MSEYYYINYYYINSLYEFYFTLISFIYSVLICVIYKIKKEIGEFDLYLDIMICFT